MVKISSEIDFMLIFHEHHPSILGAESITINLKLS